MIVDCISDLHGFHPELEGGDLLIVAGDLTALDTRKEYEEFIRWLNFISYKYKKIIIIAGNHDGKIQIYGLKPLPDNCEYLEDSGTEFEGLKIWGSPWTPEFCAWYFMKKRGREMAEVWEKVPTDTDILITHGPPYGILDKCEDRHLGCGRLRMALNRVKPKLHVFGHIHECGGRSIDMVTTKFVNASIMDGNYNAVNKPVRIIL